MPSPRKRVLFIVPSLIAGGAQRVFSILLRHLDRTRFELHLAVLQAVGPYIKDVPRDVVIHELNVSRVRYALPSVVRIIRKVKPDSVLSTLGHLNLTLIWAKPFMPRRTKLLIREAAIATPVLDEETRYPRLWKWMYRHFYGRADKIVCLSDSMVKDMIDKFGLPLEKLVRIYNPVDIDRLTTLTETANPLIGNGPHIVAASRLCRQKGFDILLDAMPVVLAKIPSAQLWILGNGPLEADLKAQSTKLMLTEAVHFLGFQENPWPYLKHADVFVLSSRYEGLPNVVLESLALGTDVIATNCPGGLQEIQSAGNPVTLVPPENPLALGAAIAENLERKDNKRKQPQLGEYNLQRVVEQYSQLF